VVDIDVMLESDVTCCLAGMMMWNLLLQSCEWTSSSGYSSNDPKRKMTQEEPRVGIVGVLSRYRGSE